LKTGGLDIGSILGSLGGGAAVPGGFDIGTLLSGLGNIGAAPGSNAEINVIVAGYKDVESKLTVLDTAAKALGTTASETAIKDLLTKSQAVTAALKGATDNINKAKAITDLFASAELSSPGDSLTVLLETTVDDLIAKKDVLAAQKVTILKELKEQKDATSAFTNTINGKLPMIAQLVASGTSQRPINALQKG
jgi:hypothetical protein